ncbi:MAG: serpin family protein, partial [Actinomycetales bacterium]|nr:serpin family protein [Actinomycetales bacterium]
LKAALGPLGLTAPFVPTGELDGVFREAYVSAAVQSATITVAEKGTVAAAVTQLDLRAGSAPPEPDAVLRLDRPFDFQIVEVDTMLPLFVGHVADPSQGR